MSKITVIFLLFLCVAIILIAGCTNQATPASSTTAAPTPVPTTAVTIVTTAAPVQTAAPVTIITTTAPAPDPILHRWVRQYTSNGKTNAYEFRFYPDGTLNYRQGPSTMVSDNIKLITPPTVEASGTWVKLGNNTYLIKFLPGGTGSSGIVREYTLMPAYIDPAYPGVTIPEHIESSYETEAINKGQQKQADEMYYPERAKID